MMPTARWRTTLGLAAPALLLFPLLHYSRGLAGLAFFETFTIVGAGLVVLALTLDRGFTQHLKDDARTRPAHKLLIGLGSAAVLYAVFAVGNVLARRILPFGDAGIESVYALKHGQDAWRLAILLGLVIGPAEELFWRGVLQRRLQGHLGGVAGFAVATLLYTGTHLTSGNPMLILAALVCGAAWGGLYLTTGSILIVTVSHTLWDLAAFVIWPFH